MVDSTPPPDSILTGFQVGHATPVALGGAWGDGWRCDRAVLLPSAEPARGTWTAQIMDRIRPVGVSVARPLRSSDGRYSVGGWTARTFLSGHRAPRFDETAAGILRFNEALVEERRPAFLGAPSAVPGGARGRDPMTWGDAELFAAADAAAWADDPTVELGPVMDPSAVPRDDVAAAVEKAAGLLLLRSEVTAPDQLVHGDALGCTVYDGYADPAVVDFVPAWHPTAWSVALLVVDALAWASAEDALLDRWRHLADFDQILLRAVIYRLFVHAILPDSSPEAWPGLARVADIVAARESRSAASGESASGGRATDGPDSPESPDGAAEPAGSDGTSGTEGTAGPDGDSTEGAVDKKEE
jgi:uncharacterized protein (TIGR02569 family)